MEKEVHFRKEAVAADSLNVSGITILIAMIINTFIFWTADGSDGTAGRQQL